MDLIGMNENNKGEMSMTGSSMSEMQYECDQYEISVSAINTSEISLGEIYKQVR